MLKKSAKKGQKLSRKFTLSDSLTSWGQLAILLMLIVAGLYYTRSFEGTRALPSPPANALYKQKTAPIDMRVDDLLSRMTLKEKLGQMAMVDKNSVKKPQDIAKYSIGAVLSGAGAKPADNTPAGWLAMVESLKTEAQKSRLGIPLLYGVDATHGHANVPGATVFPHDIGLGASHDSDLVRSVAAATGEELVATGINWNFAPSLDAPEDIRWGRAYEAFSSDPALNARLGAAYIEGNQMFTLGTAKHFLAAGSMQWQSSSNKNFKIDQGTTVPNEKLLDDEYMVPFAAASRAEVSSVMVGLNHWGNHRLIDDPHLITDKLKKETGFAGFVVSDWYGVYEFAGKSKYQANVDTINAGLDMAMLPFDYKNFIKDMSKAVQKGDIDESRINEAVRRILYQKFQAGLFDDTSPKVPVNTIGSAAHRSLARRAVAESAVLIKNNENLLPLSKASGHILVAGSGADNIGRQCGAWTVEWQGIDGNWLPGATSILQGIRAVVGSAAKIDYEKDANFPTQPELADVGIAIISEKPYAEGWGDNANPTIEPADAAAVARLKTQAKKVILVTVTGRPIFINDQIAASDAVVAAWLPGSEGAGLADVLFGDQPFVGRLPIAWPATPAQLPIRTNGTTADNTPPLFPRGFSAK
jgi:beta-glucosidase